MPKQASAAHTTGRAGTTPNQPDELGGADEVEGLVLRRARLQLVTAIFSIHGGAALAFATSLSTSIVVAGSVLMVTGGLLAVTMTEAEFERPSTAGRVGAGPLTGLAMQIREAVWSFKAALVAGAVASGSSRSLRTLAVVLILSGLASEAVDRLDIRRLDNLGQASSLGEIGGGLILGGVAAATTVPTALAISVALTLLAGFVAFGGASAHRQQRPA